MKATVAKARRSKKKEELDQGVPKEGCHEQAEQNLVNPIVCLWFQSSSHIFPQRHYEGEGGSSLQVTLERFPGESRFI